MRIRYIAAKLCRLAVFGMASIAFAQTASAAPNSAAEAPEPSTIWLDSMKLDVADLEADGLSEPDQVPNTTLETATQPISSIDSPVPYAPKSIVEGSVLDRYQTQSRLPVLGGNCDGSCDVATPSIGCSYQLRSLSWIQVDYLLWWMEGQQIPELARDTAGNTIVGDERLKPSSIDGVRIRGGHFFDCEGACGLMYEFFGFNSADAGSSTGNLGTGGGLLPYTDMDLSIPANTTNSCACLDGLVGTPRTVPLDSLSVRSSSDVFSAGIYGRSRLNSCYDCCRRDCCCNGGMNRCGFRWDAIYGYRHFGVDERLSISSALSPSTGAINAVDTYSTRNDFNGFDFGFIYERDCGRWGWELLSRMAIGVNQQRLRINGEGNLGGGVFAQYTNIGEYEHSHFAVIPEINLNASYNLTCNVRARMGYSFMWISNVVRPGQQIDTQVDGRFFDVTQPRPLNSPLAFFPRDKFDTESLWLQGLNFGLEYWY